METGKRTFLFLMQKKEHDRDSPVSIGKVSQSRPLNTCDRRHSFHCTPPRESGQPFKPVDQPSDINKPEKPVVAMRVPASLIAK